MARTPDLGHSGGRLTRRSALIRLGAITLGLTAVGCAPHTLVGRALYPESVALDADTVLRMLVAFAAVVLPEPDAAVPVVRRFADPSLRFTDYRAPLVADLMRRAQARNGTDRFDRLGEADRVAIVQDGLDGGAVCARLYGGAVFLTRIVYYCGLWNERGACAVIDYPGAYVFAGYEAVTWPHPERFLPAATTADGNPA